MKHFITTALAILSLGTSSGMVLAHGDQAHGQQAPAAAPAHDGHAAALGEPGDAARVTRRIRIVMSDAMRFSPAAIEVRSGEIVRFEVVNAGKVRHELVLGTRQELADHAAQMRKHPEMEHDDPNAVAVAPGRTGTLVWKFAGAGRYEFACLLPGHFEAGMVGQVAVRAK